MVKHYDIIGEIHLSVTLLNCIDTHFKSARYLDGLLMGCESKLFELDHIRKTKPKHVFFEGVNDIYTNHISKAIRLIEEKYTKQAGSEAIYLDHNNEQYEKHEWALTADDQWQDGREEEWMKMILEKNNGLIIAGNWHVPRIKRQLKKQGAKANIIYRQKVPMFRKSKKQLEPRYIDLIQQVYNNAKYKNRYEIESIERFLRSLDQNQ